MHVYWVGQKVDSIANVGCDEIPHRTHRPTNDSHCMTHRTLTLTSTLTEAYRSRHNVLVGPMKTQRSDAPANVNCEPASTRTYCYGLRAHSSELKFAVPDPLVHLSGLFIRLFKMYTLNKYVDVSISLCEMKATVYSVQRPCSGTLCRPDGLPFWSRL